MIEKVKTYFIKTFFNREITSYLIVGFITTVINILLFHIFTKYVLLPILAANFIAWVGAVLFAYAANDQIVFKNQKEEKKWFRRLWQFIVCRIASLVIDEIGMLLFVDVMRVNHMLSKVLINGIVIIMNYVFSKKIIFR